MKGHTSLLSAFVLVRQYQFSRGKRSYFNSSGRAIIGAKEADAAVVLIGYISLLAFFIKPDYVRGAVIYAYPAAVA